MATGITLAGNDLSGLGFRLREGPSGLDDSVRITQITAPVPRVPGAVSLALTPRTQPRIVTVDGFVQAATKVAVEANLDELRNALRQGGRLAVDWRPGWELEALGETQAAPVFGAQALQLDMRVRLVFNCLQPYWISTTQQTPAFGAALSMLGSAPVRPVFRLTSGTNPLLEYKDHAGVLVQSLQITGVVVNPMLIDCDALTISNGGTPDANLLTAGDFIELDRVHADAIIAPTAWPRVDITGGAGQIEFYPLAL